MTLQIDTFVLGPLETNCYVLREGTDCWVVDPAFGCREMVGFLRGLGVRPGRILLTHGHGDHIAGLPELRRAFPQARVCCPEGDAFMLPDAQANLSSGLGLPIAVDEAEELLRAGEELRLGGSLWRVLDTAGHTPGGVSYHCPAGQVVLTGDALFAGGIGRSDLPGADGALLVRNIRLNLLGLPEETRVLPGHGPETTILQEKQNNPFLWPV